MDNKQCENHCPKCNGENIDWGDIEVYDGGIYQKCVCEDCDCIFKEYYKYADTEITE